MNHENNDPNEYYQLQQQIQELEKIAKTKMTKEAISRYGNLKIAHPQKAIKAIVAIAQAVQSGLNEPIDDENFKKILRQI